MKDRLNDTVSELCTLYGNMGYTKYKMKKFEEYDLYVRNKDFLVSDNVITFTDTNGKLMALKPDVTLSIIKNSRDSKGSIQKVYYDENVYRVAKGTSAFKEIKQLGLECFGDIDDYSVSEVISAAIESLKKISFDYMLDISNISILTEILDNCDLSNDSRKAILDCISMKNSHEMVSICKKNEVCEETTEILKTLCRTYGKPSEVLPVLKKILPDNDGVKQLEKLVMCFEDDNVEIDFSVINDINYYNGIIFKGFIKGVPDSVLTGGQYDNLMKRMKLESKAIGFAVYIDLIEEILEENDEYDADVLILYDGKTELKNIKEEMKKAVDSSKSAAAVKAIPEKLRYRQLIDLTEKGAKANG